jgi:phosphotransferase system enzyme I (PtsP)
MTEIRAGHLNLICDIGELASLISESRDVQSLLQKAVKLVASHLKADVGSIYLYEESTDTLTLAATVGLDPRAVGSVSMTSDEGLVGYTLMQMAPVCEGCAESHPRFKYFETSGEERYKSFLSVPISLANDKIGVLVVQHAEKDYFNPSDVMALRAIASQLAGIVANARLMMALRQPKTVAVDPASLEALRFVKGEATAGGYAQAPAAILRPVDPFKEGLPDDAYHHSDAKFRTAMQKTAAQLQRLQDRLVRQLPESAALIFNAHLMILRDPKFSDQISERIKQGTPAPVAVRQVARHFMDLFGHSPNSYIREKSQDIEDLARRLLFNLEKMQRSAEGPMEGRIVIASHLYPSDILKLASANVAGIIFIGGGVTSHVAIIARSLKIPMIITHVTDLLKVPEGTLVVMDADMGTIYVDPSEEVRRQFRQRNRAQARTVHQKDTMQPETVTRDGERIELLANINLLSELALAKDLKAGGVGLYRSEFPFIVRSAFPTEEEQRVVYSRLFEAMPGRPVFIRTLDVGGDKVLPYLNSPKEENPELGLRSIRFSLQNRDIFDQQLRAILRAGAHSDQLGIMFPMISSLDEFRQARQAVADAQAALKTEGLDYHPKPMVGAMVETPSLVTLMDDLAREADFFSVGTNDFIQYLLAVDRTNENVAAYYQPYHPAVLRSLAHIVATAHKHGKPISVCGEVAHQTDFIPFLLGIGVKRLSVDPQFLPLIQNEIRKIPMERARAHARQLLSAATVSEMAAYEY